MEMIKNLARLERLLEREFDKALEKEHTEYADYVSDLLSQVYEKTLEEKLKSL